MLLRIDNKDLYANSTSDCGFLIDFTQCICTLDDFNFFLRWNQQRRELPKSEYARNIEFQKESGECGVLKGCFPVVSEDEDYVVIYYDVMEIYNPATEFMNNTSEYIPDAAEMKNKKLEADGEKKKNAKKRVGELLNAAASNGYGFLTLNEDKVKEMEDTRITNHLIERLREKGYRVENIDRRVLKVTF